MRVCAPLLGEGTTGQGLRASSPVECYQAEFALREKAGLQGAGAASHPATAQGSR